MPYSAKISGIHCKALGELKTSDPTVASGEDFILPIAALQTASWLETSFGSPTSNPAEVIIPGLAVALSGDFPGCPHH